jgi:hypothetical protein
MLIHDLLLTALSSPFSFFADKNSLKHTFAEQGYNAAHCMGKAETEEESPC